MEETMLLRIVRGKLIPGKWSEFESAYLSAIKEAGAVEGLCGRWLVQDVNDSDQGSTISLWTSEETLLAYERSDEMKKIGVRLAPFFSGQYDSRVSRLRYAEGDPAPDEWLSPPLEC
jgi:heme-degrading monooxygenase HmoA